MNNSTVLVVDDERSLREFVRKNLEIRGYKVFTASNGIEALAIFNVEAINLVILDIMMPKMDGLMTTSRIRQTSLVPILILTALGDEKDKIRAFDLGADDYLTKPFGVGELLARIKAVLRRAQWTEPVTRQKSMSHGKIHVDLERHEVKVEDELIKLTPTEFSLLVYLMENAGKMLSHRAILQNVWGPEYGEETEYLRVYIGHLRQKIEVDPADPEYLLTERGMGYRFEIPENNP